MSIPPVIAGILMGSLITTPMILMLPWDAWTFRLIVGPPVVTLLIYWLTKWLVDRGYIK